MKIQVLLVNYSEDAQKLYVPLLAGHGIIARAASAMQDALVLLVEGDYSFVVIDGDHCDYLPLSKAMRRLTTVPIGVFVSRYYIFADLIT